MSQTKTYALPDDAQAFATQALTDSMPMALTNPDFQIRAVAARVRLNFPKAVGAWPVGVLEHLLNHERYNLMRKIADEAKARAQERLEQARSILNAHAVNELLVRGLGHPEPEDDRE